MRNENGSMCEMNDFQFRIALTRTHAGFWFILPFFSILLHAGKRDDVTPTGRAVESRAHRARDAQCAAPTGGRFLFPADEFCLFFALSAYRFR